MTPPQIALHAVGFTVALAGVALGWRESTRDAKENRYPLLAQAVSWQAVLGAVGMMVLAGLALVPVLASGLIPRGDPTAFVMMLAWFCIATVSLMIAVIAWQVRRNALGWLTRVGDNQLRAEVDGRSVTITLRPKSVRLYYLANALNYGQYVQIDLHDGDTVVHVWSMITLRDHDLVTEGVLVRPEGLLVASSAGPLFRWLRPFVINDPLP